MPKAVKQAFQLVICIQMGSILGSLDTGKNEDSKVPSAFCAHIRHQAKIHVVTHPPDADQAVHIEGLQVRARQPYGGVPAATCHRHSDRAAVLCNGLAPLEADTSDTALVPDAAGSESSRTDA